MCGPSFGQIFGLDDYGLTVLSLMLLLAPAVFYILAVLEGKWGKRFFITGLIAHLISMSERWATTGRIPLAEKHDNISFMALGTALVYWYFRSRKGAKDIAPAAMAITVMFIFISFGHRMINTISPFMNSPWFYLHSFFFFISFGFFGVGACMAANYVISGNVDYEQMSYKSIMHGWIMLSISFFAGGVWFYLAYGTYWLWTSKELWLTAVWIYYGLYLHARLIKGLNGKPAAAMGAAGFLVSLFAYFGVGTVIPAPPTQF